MRRNGRYRFPISAIAFMSVSFAGIVLAIGMAARAAQALTRFTEHEAEYAALPGALLQPFVAIFALTIVVTVVISAILFLGRRSGVHRLAEARTWPVEH